MRVNCLITRGQGYFEETQYECPDKIDNGIIVKNIMTGVCRSDIDMMRGLFGPLPLGMMGHEGLARVVYVSPNLHDKVQVGDIVATRGEPAYADLYSVREQEFVCVPEAHPRYIIEPVACAFNLIDQEYKFIMDKLTMNSRVLILGSGFLAYVVYQYLKRLRDIEIDVVGSNNREIWQNIVLLKEPRTHYDLIIDLVGNPGAFDKLNLFNTQAIICEGTARSQTLKQSESLLWQGITTIRPSPRARTFHQSMIKSVELIKSGYLNIDAFWTKGYDRRTEWQQAFVDAEHRPKNYSRGYIVW
jgi:threonine dehydrogenase-like Zn-dependent dehydrogenase